MRVGRTPRARLVVRVGATPPGPAYTTCRICLRFSASRCNSAIFAFASPFALPGTRSSGAWISDRVPLVRRCFARAPAVAPSTAVDPYHNTTNFIPHHFPCLPKAFKMCSASAPKSLTVARTSVWPPTKISPSRQRSRQGHPSQPSAVSP
jgi:hypothetical protein